MARHFVNSLASNNMKTTLVCLFGFLCLWCGVQSAPADACSKEALQQRQLQCFLQNNVNLGGESAVDVQAAVQDNPAAVCAANINSYSAAITCAFSHAEDCLRLAGVNPSILPNASKIIDGVKFLCQHVDDFNAECTKNAKSELTTCATVRVLTALRGMSGTPGVEEITCASFEMTYECMKDRMGHCGQKNLELNLAYMNEYVRPPVCQDFDPDGNDYPRGDLTGTTVAPQVATRHVTDPTVTGTSTTELVTQYVTGHSDSATSTTELLQKVKQCFDEAGVDVDPQNPNVMDFFHVVPFDKDFTYAVCRDKSKYNRAFTCTFDVAKQILPADVLDYLPQTSFITVFLNDLCDYADKRYINFTCTAPKVTEYRNCNLRKSNERKENDNEIPCQGLNINIECHKEILEECGCRTSHLFIKLFKGLNSPKCPAIEIPTPDCDPVTGDYSENGATPVHSLSSFLTVSVAVLLGSFARL